MNLLRADLALPILAAHLSLNKLLKGMSYFLPNKIAHHSDKVQGRNKGGHDDGCQIFLKSCVRSDGA